MCTLCFKMKTNFFTIYWANKLWLIDENKLIIIGPSVHTANHKLLPLYIVKYRLN